MTDDKKRCSACRELDRYYVKGDKQFNKTDYGWCNKKQASVNVKDCCDDFALGYIHRGRFGRTKHYLNELLLQITSLRCIIEEHSDDKKKE